MSGLFGGGQSPTQSTTFKLGPEQKALFDLAFPYLKEGASAGPPKLPEGSGIAPFDPAQISAQNMALGAVPTVSSLAGSAAGANNFLLGDVLLPESNPALRGYIDSATRPIFENLNESVLPSIRADFGDPNTANFSNSGRGIATGQAIRGAESAAGDAASRIASTAYGQGLDAMTRGLGLLPQTQGAQLAPAQATSAVGDVRQEFAQQILNEMLNRYMYEQTAPLEFGKELIGVTGSLPGGTSVSTGSVPSANPLTAGIGGAAAGGSLASTLFPSLAGAGPVGAGIGALLAFL